MGMVRQIAIYLDNDTVSLKRQDIETAETT